MYIENGFYLELTETSAVTALVGIRIYYVKAPQDAVAPYVVIQEISNTHDSFHSGANPLQHCRMQISIFDTTYKSCKAIADAIQTGMDGFSGVMGTGGPPVGGCFHDMDNDLPYDDDTGLYGIAVDYIIHYTR